MRARPAGGSPVHHVRPHARASGLRQQAMLAAGPAAPAAVPLNSAPFELSLEGVHVHVLTTDFWPAYAPTEIQLAEVVRMRARTCRARARTALHGCQASK